MTGPSVHVALLVLLTAVISHSCSNDADLGDAAAASGSLTTPKVPSQDG